MDSMVRVPKHPKLGKMMARNPKCSPKGNFAANFGGVQVEVLGNPKP